MEGEIIKPSYHMHALILKQYNERGVVKSCCACGKTVTDLEMAYVCMKYFNNVFVERCSTMILHKKCGEVPLPSEIRHSKHPNHPIHLRRFDHCDECGRDLNLELGYRCDPCDFNICLECKRVGFEVLVEERKELEHPSHPHHPLTLMRKLPFSFPCDGCGVEDVDMAYICSTCDFWVHKSCALLPLLRECRHHHPLSLAFSFPEKHLKFKYKCEVCDKHFYRTHWVYFCGDCRYFVHVKCIEEVGSSSTNIPDYSHTSKEDVIEFPLHENDISDKLIAPFVMRQTGLDHIPPDAAGTSNSTSVFEYHHEHPLRLVSESTHKDEDEDEDGDEDEDEDEDGESKICDVCITPISSSTPYYKCATHDACTYSIHSICSSLPHTLQYPSSSTSHLLKPYGDCNEIPNINHNFTLYYKSKGTSDAISHWRCDLCRLPTNGMGYECGDCGKKIDVKCASLPTSIRHASHTRRHHEPLTLTLATHASTKKRCHVCNESFADTGDSIYVCSVEGGCDFALHFGCALLPLSVTNGEWDKHQLLLTSDAARDHPSDFFCEFCEEEMHPKNWMYHCRHCDASFHLYCLDTGSGYYRNMKLGGRYEFEEIHPNHPLTYTCVTLKKHCDLCHRYWNVYTYLGFECASCYYVLCENCGVVELS